MQTEDSGITNPHLFTHLFHGGVILSSRKLDYDAEAAEEVVRALMQAQHKAVLKGLRRGEFDDKIDAYLGNHPDLQPRESGPGPESAPDQAVPGAATPAPPADMVAPPADMVAPPADMVAPPADMVAPPADMVAPPADMAAPMRAQTEPDHVPPVHTPAPHVAAPMQPGPPVNPGHQAALNRPAGTSASAPGRSRRASTEINPVVPPPRPVHPAAAKPPPATRHPAAATPAARQPATPAPLRPRRPSVAPPPPPRSVPPIPRRHQTTQPGIGKSSPNLDIPRQSTRGNVLVSRPPIVVESNSRITPPPPPQPPPAVRAARIPPARTVREEPQDGIFEQNLISEKSLDEVILAYLSEDGSDD